MSTNEAILRQLTQKKNQSPEDKGATAAKPKRGSSFKTKALKYMPSNTTMLDLALFAGACYVIYEFGDKIAQGVNFLIPNEKDILEQMQAQQAQMQQMQMQMQGPPM